MSSLDLHRRLWAVLLFAAAPVVAAPIQLAAVTTTTSPVADNARSAAEAAPDGAASYTQLAAIPGAYGLLAQSVMGALLPDDSVRVWREFLGLGSNLGEGYKQLAAAAYQQQEWATAAPLYAVAHDLLPNDSSFLAQLGFAYKEIGEYEKAEEFLFQASINEPENYDIWLWLGDAQRLLGNYEDSYISMLALIENAPSELKAEYQAYAAYTQGLATTVPDWATFERHREFALRHDKTGRWRRVIAEYYHSLDVAPAVGFDANDAPLRMGWVNRTIGSNYNHLKEFDVALDHWRRSRAFYESTESWPDVTSVVQSIGETYFWMADRDTENREADYMRSIAAREDLEEVATKAEQFNHARYGLGARIYELAQIRRIDDPELVELRARGLLELPFAPPINDFSVAAIAEGELACRLLEGDYAGARIVLEMLLPYFLESKFLTESERGARHLASLAHVHNAMGHPDQALIATQRGLEELRELRQFLDADGFNRSSSGKTYRYLYTERARAFVLQEKPELALAAMEIYKSQSRRDLLGSKITDEAARTDYKTEEELVRWRLPKLQADLEQAYADRDEQLSAHLETRIANDEALLKRLEKHLTFPPPGRLSVRRIEALDAEALRIALPDDIALLHLVLDAFGGVAVLAGPEGVTGTLLPNATDLKARTLVNTFLDKRVSDAPAANEALAELYDIIIAPIRGSLTTATLCIATDETLSLLPIDALHDGTRALVEDFNIVRVPSGSYLAEARKQNRTVHDTALALVNRDGLAEGLEAALAAGGFDSAETLAGTEATESVLVSGANGANVLHLAAPADFLTSDAMLSGIELSPGEGTDGSLYAAEMLTLSLPASLVVLDIDAATGDATVPGRGLGALAEGLVHTGVPTLIYNLWPDDATESAAFFKAFYANLATMSKSEALRAAKLAMRSAEGEGFNWSAYVLQGDYR